jgi:uncharacterized protein YcnI
MHRPHWGHCLAALLLLARPALSAQVTITPREIVPADLVRFAVQVASASDTGVVAVRIEVPDALAVLGLDAPAGWTARLIAGTDSTPQKIEWVGGPLLLGGYREFAFFARVAATAHQQSLVFPVRLERSDGSAREWRDGRDGGGLAPQARITGSVGVTAQGAFALAAAAGGLAGLALAIALRRR